MKKFFSLLLSICMLGAFVACGDTTGSDKGNGSTPPSTEQGGNNENNGGNNGEKPPVTPPDDNKDDGNEKPTDKVDVTKLVDFVVEVEPWRDPIVLQLTDPQIIDAAQERYATRLDAATEEYWATDKVWERYQQCFTETILKTNPDLIIITGDIVYGEFDDNGTAFEGFVNFMDSFDIPWAPVFGNHENESAKGVDWQCDQFEAAENCLFKQRTLTGNGNYSVGIMQGESLTRVFYMLDSNGCGSASSQSMANGHMKKTAGFGSDQIQWYTNSIGEIHKVSPSTKISFAYHIQQAAFLKAFEAYGFTGESSSLPIDIDKHPDKKAGDFGYLGEKFKAAWDEDYTVWNGMKALGVDSVFIGHIHANSASVVYDGIRCQFGQKSSTYDKANYVNANGNIVASYVSAGDPIIGGTVIVLSKDSGEIKDGYIYYATGNVRIDYGFDGVPELFE